MTATYSAMSGRGRFVAGAVNDPPSDADVADGVNLADGALECVDERATVRGVRSGFGTISTR